MRLVGLLSVTFSVFMLCQPVIFLSGCTSSIHSKKLPHILVKHISFSLLTDSLSGCATIQSSPLYTSFIPGQREREQESLASEQHAHCAFKQWGHLIPLSPLLCLRKLSSDPLELQKTPPSLGYTQLEHRSQNHKAGSKTSTGFDWLTRLDFLVLE